MQLILSYILSAPALRRLLRGFARVAAARNGRSCISMPGRSAAAFYSTAIAPALLFIILAMAPAISHAAVQGDQIINTARLTTGGVAIANTSVNVSVVIRTPSKTEFLKYTPGATPVNVVISAYHKAGDPAAQFTDMGQPALPINLPNLVPLATAPFFHPGEPIFIRVTDLDQNLDRTVRETVIVTVTDDNTTDKEVVRLTETGPDTGVFVGYVRSTLGSSPAPQYNGLLSITAGDNIRASYTDIADSTDTSFALVDPFGIVFNSSTGAPINGVTITLIDDNTGLAATTIRGDDGVSPFPATVITGGHPTDDSGRSYDFPPGGFRFPFLPSGNYRFKIEPPSGFAGPSANSYSDLTDRWGDSFIIRNPGSKLEPFRVNPDAPFRIDIPLDPAASALWLQKSAGKETVAVGDFLPYQLDVKNNDKNVALQGIIITDTMPLGFRFRKGSVRINGAVAPDPAISVDGRTLTFSVGDLATEAVASVRYVVEVAAGAQIGIATNLATARSAIGITSNLAKASVQVKSDFLSSKSILMGQVIAGACGAPDKDALKGVEGVRIFLEDGTFVDTDKRGMFHFEGIATGSHVVQLDLDSLPNDYRVVPCEENTRFSGSSYSQFVDLQGGSMWRVDFHVARQAKARKATPDIPPTKGEVSIELTSALYGETIVYQAPLQGHNLPKDELQFIVTLPEGVVYEVNSSQLDGKPFADPAINGSVLTYPLGSRPGDWNTKLRFRAALPRSGSPGKMLSSATITGISPSETGKKIPIAETELKRVLEEDHFRMPEFVLHPHFPTFSAELSDEDRTDLDDLARLLMVLNIEKINVTGHTDNVRIAPRSRKIFRDNMALSLGRAESVGRYLIEKLHLPLSKLQLTGMGEKAPVADNRTNDGKALNRRVEIKVQTEKVLNTICHEILKEKSGVQKAEVSNPASRPKPVADEEAPDAVKPGEKAGNGITEKEGFLSPQANTILIHPINAVRVCIPAALTPRLLLDGHEVPA